MRTSWTIDQPDCGTADQQASRSRADPAPAATSAPAGAARGSRAQLKSLIWQGPTILNVHLAQGTRDAIAARFCTEPLMTLDAGGSFSPVLAAQVPSKDNGGLGADGKTVTYMLKQGIKWADGKPFTADDLLFTYQYVTNIDTAATTPGNYVDLTWCRTSSQATS